MKKKTVTMVSSVAVLAILCGAYYVVQTYVSEQEQSEEENEEEITDIFSVESDDITKLKFVIDKTEVVFQKDGDEWYKEDEEAFPVDQDILEDAASSISSVTSDIVINDVEDLSQYGLDDPSNTITISTEDGNDTVLKVGDENDSVSQYYVEKGDNKETVYLVDSVTIDPFMNSLYDYAQSDDFPDISSEYINKINVLEEDSSYEISKDEDSGLWYVSDETYGEEKADSSKASSLTSAVSTLEYSSFVDYNCSNLADYGLEQPYGTLTVEYQEKIETSDENTSEEDDSDAQSDLEKALAESSSDSEEEVSEDTEEETELVSKELILYVGDTAENDTRYVKVNDSNEIYTIAQENLDTIFGKTVSDLWDLTVNYLSVNDLDSLEIEEGSDKHEINVSRETSENEDGEEEETITYQLDGTDIDTNLFTTFYNKLINMAGQRRLTDEFLPEEEAVLNVTLYDLDGNTSLVEFFEYDANFYAVRVGEKVFLVNKMDVKELLDSYESLISENYDEEGSDTLQEKED